MEAKEFDSTANTGMSSEQSRVAIPEAAVGEPPPATLNGAATTFVPAAAPEGAIAAAATDEVTWTVAAASAPNKTKDEQGDKEEVPSAVASVAAAAGVATARVGSAHSMDGESCDMELAPSTPQPAAGAEGVEMFTTPMQQLPVDDAHLPVSRQENDDRFKDFGELMMDQMSSILDKLDKLDKQSAHAQGREDQMSSILDKHLITLQEKIDERVETGLIKAKKGLTVRFDAAQEQTGKRIDDVAGHASALSKRLDKDQAEWIRKTKDTNFEQENKVSRKFDSVANSFSESGKEGTHSLR